MQNQHGEMIDDDDPVREACRVIANMIESDDGESFEDGERFVKRHAPDIYNVIGVSAYDEPELIRDAYPERDTRFDLYPGAERSIVGKIKFAWRYLVLIHSISVARAAMEQAKEGAK